jgi:hypothetical protein
MNRPSALSQRLDALCHRFYSAKQAALAKGNATSKRLCVYTRNNRMQMLRAKTGCTREVS